MRIFFEKLTSFAKFEEESAEERRSNPDHEDRTPQWDERYWHGYAAAMRSLQEQLKSYNLIVRGWDDISHPLDVFKIRIKRYEVKNRSIIGEQSSGMSYRDFSEFEDIFAV